MTTGPIAPRQQGTHAATNPYNASHLKLSFSGCSFGIGVLRGTQNGDVRSDPDRHLYVYFACFGASRRHAFVVESMARVLLIPANR